MIRRTFMLLGVSMLLGACATGATLMTRPLDSGTSMEFAVPAPQLAEVTKKALVGLNLPITSAAPNGDSTVINFEKGMTAFSWGEVGRVVVTPISSTTSRVFVDTEKRSQMQITGTSEAEFARDIFDAIKMRLP